MSEQQIQPQVERSLYPPVQHAPRRPVWPWLVAIFVAIGATVGITLAVVTASGNDDPSSPNSSFFGDDTVDEPKEFTVTGKFTLTSYDSIDSDGTECWGSGGYDDIQPGAQVKVSDSAGKVLAIGELESLAYEFGECVFTFEVLDVPDGEKLYQIEVSHRGTITYSEDEMREYLSLTLGD